MLNLAPPTDNLYKFISIFGLVLILSSAYTITERHNRVLDESGLLETHIEKHILDSTLLINQKNNIKYDIDFYYQMTNQNLDPIVTDTAIFYVQQFDAPKYIQDFANVIESKRDQFFERQAEYVGSSLIIQNEIFSFNSIANGYLLIKIVCGTFIVLGLIITLTGFILWYNRVQFYQDKVLKDQYIKIKHD